MRRPVRWRCLRVLRQEKVVSHLKRLGVWSIADSRMLDHAKQVQELAGQLRLYLFTAGSSTGGQRAPVASWPSPRHNAGVAMTCGRLDPNRRHLLPLLCSVLCYTRELFKPSCLRTFPRPELAELRWTARSVAVDYVIGLLSTPSVTQACKLASAALR